MLHSHTHTHTHETGGHQVVCWFDFLRSMSQTCQVFIWLVKASQGGKRAKKEHHTTHQSLTPISKKGYFESDTDLISSKRVSMMLRMGLVSPCSRFRHCCGAGQVSSGTGVRWRLIRLSAESIIPYSSISSINST